MHRSYEYRLYPNPEQSDALDTILIQSRRLYNEALAHRRAVYKHTGQSVSYVDQAQRFKHDRTARVEDYGMLGAVSVQQLLRRLAKTFASSSRARRADAGSSVFKGTMGRTPRRCGRAVQSASIKGCCPCWLFPMAR